MSKEVEQITLTENDCCIVFRANGDRELILPTCEHEDDDVPETSFLALLCITFLQDEKLVDQVREQLKQGTVKFMEEH